MFSTKLISDPESLAYFGHGPRGFPTGRCRTPADYIEDPLRLGSQSPASFCYGAIALED